MDVDTVPELVRIYRWLENFSGSEDNRDLCNLTVLPQGRRYLNHWSSYAHAEYMMWFWREKRVCFIAPLLSLLPLSLSKSHGNKIAESGMLSMLRVMAERLSGGNIITS
ncbi:unnamed protein product [Prorocentrum cordatum]|uniref:Uncharacterized protein n=1 Tax=Prorocentrum cordatum TaxID=2364126 RepID=A0ABN9TGU0_9DINO|nr:unnamed protein product [Polarella glacialis]